MTETEIAGRRVPIKSGPRTVIYFSGGRLKSDEPGNRQFWTAVNIASNRGATARCRPGDDPGERFRQMEKSPADADGWKVARLADYLRPSMAEEVEGWLNAKPDDAPYAESGELGGAKVRVVKERGRYQVVPHGS